MGTTTPETSTQDPGASMLTAGNTDFAVDLYHALCGDKGNLFFSPFSISTALAMTFGGARGNTEAEMAHALHFEVGQSALHPAFAALASHLNEVQARGDVALHVANSLWPETGYRLLETYLELCRRYYGVTITPVNYAADPEGARSQINGWVEHKTNDKIKDLLQPEHITPITTLILVNAIYFKGNWASQFDTARTEDAPFLTDAPKSVRVPMMTQTLECGYGKEDGLQILSLPYVGEDLSMVILLPNAQDGLAGLEGQLTADLLTSRLNRLHKTKVHVFLPRFKLTGAFNLRGVLTALGMIDAFDRADFSGMTGRQDLFISDVIHKAFVDVNEEGTEAAAATAVIMARSLPMPPPTFRADHPFIFLIRDNATGSILFLGRVVDPTPET